MVEVVVVKRLKRWRVEWVLRAQWISLVAHRSYMRYQLELYKCNSRASSFRGIGTWRMACRLRFGVWTNFFFLVILFITLPQTNRRDLSCRFVRNALSFRGTALFEPFPNFTRKDWAQKFNNLDCRLSQISVYTTASHCRKN